MRLVIAVLSGALLLGAGSSQAQDASGTSAEPGTAAAQPVESPAKPGAGVEGPKADPKLLIDVFNLLTKPRRPPVQPAPPPPPPSVGPVAAAPLPVPPTASAPAPQRPQPTTVTAAPREVKPRLPPAPKPHPRAVPPTPQAAPAEMTAVPAPPEPAVAAPTQSMPPPSPEAPVIQSVAPPSSMAPPARSSSLLSQVNWVLLALFAAAAIAAVVIWHRMRQIARTRAALSLDPRLDLADGSASVGSLALACPPMSIRTRLEMAGG